MVVSEAREEFGTYKIIGATANTFEDVLAHVHIIERNYIVLVRFSFTTLTEMLSPILDLKGTLTRFYKN
jgi:thiamine-phosphate pyrophosphorylase